PHPQAPPAGSPRPAAGPAAESGLDLGWALACAGLLLAAACLGRPGGGTAQRRSGGAALLSWLRPLLGRR
ncbi:MAG: hypothetical protein M3131_08240, partial [Actinomycetota bacterium]|nr:hypothetical protein [Actinomycetota bacterium]